MTSTTTPTRLSWHEARSMTPIERFWHYVYESEGCLLWGGAVTEKGRPVFQVNGKTHVAYVWFWEQMMERPVREEFHLHHWCGRPACVRLGCLQEIEAGEHLRLHGEIGFRGAHNTNKIRCVHGHEFTDQNTYVDSDGKRHCRPCRAADARRFRARQKVGV